MEAVGGSGGSVGVEKVVVSGDGGGIWGRVGGHGEIGGGGYCGFKHEKKQLKCLN
jgi:hypothetical protein